MANIEQHVLYLLETYPACRVSYNRLLMTYWIIVDRLTTNRDFDQTTPAESILREARKVFAKRPDLMPMSQLSSPTDDLFANLQDVFPALQVVE